MTNWWRAEMIGYHPYTTFWQDFSIAERFGTEEIAATAHNCFEEWKHDIHYLTELIMVINHKCWDWHDEGNDELSNFYSKLYYNYDDKAISYLEKHGTEEDRHYYFQTLD